MNEVTPTDRLRSVHNRCVIKNFDGVFVMSLGCLNFFVGMKAFVIRLSSIYCFFSLYLYSPIRSKFTGMGAFVI